MADWRDSFNLPNHAPGTVRSILGYAGESLVIGRALASGFNLFFKAWRDSPYDAVLEHNGLLYRIEIKQSRDGHELSLTGGGRSGQQIDRSAGSRERLVSTSDCDLLIGVHSLSGRCWIIPTEVIEILGRTKLKTGALDDFAEAWRLIVRAEGTLGNRGLRTRLRRLPVEQLSSIASELGAQAPPPAEFQVGPRTRVTIPQERDRFALEIWRTLAKP